MKRVLLILMLMVTACGSPPAPTSVSVGTLAPTPLPAATVSTVPTSVAATEAPNATAGVEPTTPPPPSPTIPPTEMRPVVPDPQAYRLQEIARGFQHPVFVTHAGDESGRLFVVEQGGTIRIIQNGSVLPELFLDLTGVAVEGAFEQGLLGLAFSPTYATDGHFFVNYTDVNGDTVVARYSVSADANRADPASAQVVIQIDQPFRNHNGGDMAFGPDGYLYVGMGDGGSAGDPQGNGQKMSIWLGKMLRLDVSDEPYTVPSDNPFIRTAGALPEMWALGLRNPWRFSFDRATGDLYMADVGQGEWEEVNFQSAASAGGENYGWVHYEGNHKYGGGSPAGLTFPVTEYSHSEGGCSVTGGYVYRGAALPNLNGIYLFGDYCTGLIWSLYRAPEGWQRQLFMDTSLTISSFGQDEAGEVYVVDHSGAVLQVVAASP
jgi:glucose/arabinose dehydrogenase